MVEAPSDEALAGAVQQGDTNAFGSLIERYEAKLLRYGGKFLSDRADVQDVVQEAFLSAYQNIRSFDTSRRFSPWLYRIAHNAFVNELRRRHYAPRISIDFDTLVAHATAEESTDTESEQRHMRELVNRGLRELPPNYREVLILYYLESMPYKEIAEVLHIPVGTVGIRLKRAKEALREAYRDMRVESYD